MDVSNIKDTVAYQLGTQSGKIKGLKKDLKGLTKTINNGFVGQRQETGEAFRRIDDHFDKLNDKIDSRFLWMIGVVAIPLNLGLLVFLAYLLGWV